MSNTLHKRNGVCTELHFNRTRQQLQHEMHAFTCRTLAVHQDTSAITFRVVHRNTRVGVNRRMGALCSVATLADLNKGQLLLHGVSQVGT